MTPRTDWSTAVDKLTPEQIRAAHIQDGYRELAATLIRRYADPKVVVLADYRTKEETT